MLARRLGAPLLVLLLVASTACTGSKGEPQTSEIESNGGASTSPATAGQRPEEGATAGKADGQESVTQTGAQAGGSTAGQADLATAGKPQGAGGAGGAAEGSHDAPAAPSAVRPVSRRPPIPGQPLEISFDDLVIGMQADVVYRPWMLTDRAQEVDGQRVKLVGYIHGGVDKIKNLTEVILLRNRECKFGPGGQADHLVRVMLKPGVKVNYTDNAVEVQGLIKVNPWQGPDGNTWSLYDLEGDAAKDLKRK